MKLRSLEEDAQVTAKLANKQASIIREQRALLDECERIMTGVAYYSPEAASMMESTLAKLRAQERG